MIDTHVHLNDEKFDGIVDEIVDGAINNGVNRFLVVGYDYLSSKKAIEIAHKYENTYAIVGLHPSEVDKEKDKDLNWLREMVKDSKVVAIGEIGMDLYWTKEFKDLQIEYFEKQLKMAKEFNLPVSIHTRDAMELTYDILSKDDYKGVIHCFSGSLEMANKFIKRGWYLGIGGVLTFKNAKIKDVVKEIDLSHIISETDSPYLAPTPHRGEVNKPEYIKIIVEEIARIKNVDVKVVEEQIDKNVKELFNI